MKVLVLASSESKPVIRQKLGAAGSGLIFVESPEEFLEENDADAFFDLEFRVDKSRIELLTGFLPRPVFINCVDHTLTELGQSFIRISAWPTLLEKEYCEIAVADPSSRIAAEKVLNEVQWKFQVLPDTIGMVSARVIAMIINEAYFTVQEKVSSRNDIDVAMKLGTNYPYGPFEWAAKIGLKKVYELLRALNTLNSDYSIAGLLVEEAMK